MIIEIPKEHERIVTSFIGKNLAFSIWGTFVVVPIQRCFWIVTAV